MKLNPNAELETIDAGVNLPVATPVSFGQVSLLKDAKVSFPRHSLEIAYGVGEAGKQGKPPGSLLLSVGPSTSRYWVPLVEPRMPIVVVIAGVREVWREWPAVFVRGQIPREFSTLEEAIEAGLNDQWEGTYPGGIRPTVGPAMFLDLFVRAPDGVDDDAFCLKLNGHFYAPAIFRADKLIYPSVRDAVLRKRRRYAGVHDCPVAEARLDDVFMSFKVFATQRQSGNESMSVVMGPHKDPGGTADVPPKFFQDLKDLLSSASLVDPQED